MPTTPPETTVHMCLNPGPSVARPACLACLAECDPLWGVVVQTLFLGVHHGRWLEQLTVPMCVSLRTMEKYSDDWETHPKCFSPWILDSGAYNEITQFGEWRYDPDRFGGVVTRILNNVGTPPVFVAPQDWPCEPTSLAASGLTVPVHQELTIESVCYLRAEFRHIPWIPVLQGWHIDDYVKHVLLYQQAGIDLTWEPLVGLGSVCRRSGISAVVDIITTLHAMGIRLHGFGVHSRVLARCGHLVSSVDTMGWSRTARWNKTAMPGCDHVGPCTNCAAYAQRWHDTTVRRAA